MTSYRKNDPSITLFLTLGFLFLAVLGCSETARSPEWPKSRKIAGKEQGLSHINGLVVDEKYAYLSIGGTIADKNAGTNGLRRVSLSDGAVSMIDNGEKMPQSDRGGLASDETHIYLNAGGSIVRVAKSGGPSEIVTSENVGVGIDLAVGDSRVYWINHGYYSAGTPTVPTPIYSAPKTGGKAETISEPQNVPHSIAVDERYVYWCTLNAIIKQPKTGGKAETVFQAGDDEGIDELAADADSIYFGFRGSGESRWALRKVAKSGGQPVTLVKRFSLKPMVVDEANVYFFDEEGMSGDALCRVPKAGGDVVRIDTGYSSGVIAQRGSSLFFASLDTIYSIPKN